VPVTKFGAALMLALQPWLTLPLAWYLDAIGAMVDPLVTIISDVGIDDGTPTVGTYDQFGALVTTGYQAGYGALFNPSTVPLVDAEYLAQYVGVQLPVGVDQPTAQSLILAESGFKRGTPASIIAAAKRHLSGTQSTVLLERVNATGNPDAYAFVLITLTNETLTINIIPNPSFGHDTIGSAPAAWTAISMATFLVATVGSTQQLHCVTNSLASAAEAAAALTGTTISGTSNCIAVNAGDEIAVVASAIINSIPATAQVYTQVTCLTTAGSPTAVFESVVKASTAGTVNFSDIWTAPANTVKAQVFLTIVSGAASTVVDLDLTHFMLALNPMNGVIPVYFDGDTAGDTWTGTPGNSSSTSSIQPLIDAVNAVKPGGVMWTLIPTAAWIISEMEADYASITALEAAFLTITGLESDQVGF
jgi:hypothetical protein